MTDANTLRTFFESEYPGKSAIFESLIKPIFGNAKDASLTEKQEILDSDKRQIKSMSIIAQARGAFPIIFADVELQDSVVLKRSRVQIQNCVRRIMADDTNALIFFHFADTKKEWRVSYVHRAGKLNESTSAKRYTYLCGAEHQCRTVAERFAKLSEYTRIDDEKLLEAFSVESLTKEFFNQLFKWYDTWACKVARFPSKNCIAAHAELTAEHNQIHLIRLITRIMFVWFIKQKDLVPAWVFDRNELAALLSDCDLDSAETGNYYNAVLQNLFFGALNKKIEARAFAEKSFDGIPNEQYGIKALFRDDNKKSFFKAGHEEMVSRFEGAPFLNGGLFECLDYDVPHGKDSHKVHYVDGFSRNADRRAFVPNALFWSEDEERLGLIPLFSRYNFTVEESTATDVQVALDPELLGKIFENLLGTYNPETKESARKESGSFYTPREIVSYMVNRSLAACLREKLPDVSEDVIEALVNDGMLKSVADNQVQHDGHAKGKGHSELVSESQISRIRSALFSIKIIDPACGSGAFPMGILNKLVELHTALNALEGVADENLYALKTRIIEDSIFGVDIQPIAVQICKLRFFISLICEQPKTGSIENNYGYNPLPNLETKFVAANTLIGKAKKSDELDLFADKRIDDLTAELLEIRKSHFSAKTAQEKKENREKDEKLRKELSKLLEADNIYSPEDARQLAQWNPYDQTAPASPFFDAEWMFGVKDGFDVVIGNPPYKIVPKDDDLKPIYDKSYSVAHGGKRNLYHLFFERGILLLGENRVLSYISPDTYFSGSDTEALREYLINHTNIKSIVHYTEKDKVFENVTQAVAVIVLVKQKHGKTFDILVSGKNETIEYDNLNKENKYVFKSSDCVIDKMKLQKQSFGDICEGYKGDVNLALKKSYFTTSETIDTLPLVRGIQISKYNYVSGNEFCSKKALSKNHTEKKRIIFQEVANMGLSHRTKGTILRNVICGDSCNILFSKDDSKFDNRFILALLNSKSVNYYFKFFNQTNHVPIGEIKNIPIPPTTPEQQQSIIALVDKVLAAKKANRDADTTADEHKIDLLVYHLYGLSYEESKVIDDSLTEEEFE